jgi:hypothetical protein
MVSMMMKMRVFTFRERRRKKENSCIFAEDEYRNMRSRIYRGWMKDVFFDCFISFICV